MIVSKLVKIATEEFEQKMAEVGQNGDARKLTAELAEQVRVGLLESFSHACRKAYKSFLEHYDLREPLIEWQGRTRRFKTVSTKTFLTSFGKIPIDRNLYQADTGGPSCVPLDHFWDMNGHFATEDIRQAGCFAMAHMTAEETEQLLQLCSLFRPSATAIKNIVEKVSEEIEPHQKALDTKVRSHIEPAEQTQVMVASMDGRRWYSKYRTKLLELDAGAESLLRSIGYYSRTQHLSKSRRKDLATEWTFFRRNQHRMRYACFRRRGLPIGSGPVEAACKSIVKSRLCRSGMRWSREGGPRILNFRCHVKSGLWNEFWDTY